MENASLDENKDRNEVPYLIFHGKRDNADQTFGRTSINYENVKRQFLNGCLYR